MGESLLHFGRTDRGLAYFKESLLLSGGESPVFEWTGAKKLMRTASGFEEWLRRRCEVAKRSFSKEEWAKVVEGPKPFTPREMEIVEARRHFHWRVTGIGSDKSLEFEVRNASRILLPYLTVGIRGKDGTHIGGVWLPVGHVAPGMTAVVRKNCYSKWHDPRDIEAFEPGDPGPEDRDRYWEFRATVAE
jgi:hypothetical protein